MHVVASNRRNPGPFARIGRADTRRNHDRTDPCGAVLASDSYRRRIGPNRTSRVRHIRQYRRRFLKIRARNRRIADRYRIPSDHSDL